MSTIVSPQSTTTTWNIDPAHTLVEFSAKHMMITTVKGRFGEVRGTITIDEQRPETSAVEGRGRDPWGGERVSFSASAKIDRRDFGLTWNAALEAGGVLVSNDVKITIEAQAVRAA